MKINSHVYVSPSGDATEEMCDFWYNGNDRCGGRPAEHSEWWSHEYLPRNERAKPLTVREYINALNRMVIVGEVDENATVVFDLLSRHVATLPRVSPEGHLIIVG